MCTQEEEILAPQRDIDTIFGYFFTPLKFTNFTLIMKIDNVKTGKNQLMWLLGFSIKML